MAEPINLNKARKARAKAEANAAAEINRVRFGRSKAERALEVGARERAERVLEGHRREE